MNGTVTVGPSPRQIKRWARRHFELIVYAVAVVAVIAFAVRAMQVLPAMLHHKHLCEQVAAQVEAHGHTVRADKFLMQCKRGRW